MYSLVDDDVGGSVVDDVSTGVEDSVVGGSVGLTGGSVKVEDVSSGVVVPESVAVSSAARAVTVVVADMPAATAGEMAPKPMPPMTSKGKAAPVIRERLRCVMFPSKSCQGLVGSGPGPSACRGRLG
ncbi:MAG: hypothetical protein LKG20_08275 [Tetrasphaera jenkinsii]|uniref:Uncharacterized protein n=1 Tax=Nostocoides jenkinsii Ben 74 TaxID=1193518 RepID=A0A077MG16_9MICO|nr:hypothetical protein [Tetrasphaera jenkinsii]MCI1262255.1 hypothetical protein [Tetrasphaera jenkinsii]CCI54338.1 hypothetical protein BN13_680020 [Tetrasphaera jenkinsii Ben 74]